jgi:hypothetical protein
VRIANVAARIKVTRGGDARIDITSVRSEHWLYDHGLMNCGEDNASGWTEASLLRQRSIIEEHNIE